MTEHVLQVIHVSCTLRDTFSMTVLYPLIPKQICGWLCRWLAPEVVTDQAYSNAADVYSFGLILWELLTWQLPWADLGPFQVIAPRLWCSASHAVAVLHQHPTHHVILIIHTNKMSHTCTVLQDLSHIKYETAASPRGTQDASSVCLLACCTIT